MVQYTCVLGGMLPHISLPYSPVGAANTSRGFFIWFLSCKAKESFLLLFGQA